MPLSPHEEKALAALEKGLRADDPELAAAFAAAPPSTARRGVLAVPVPPLTTRHIVHLVVALLGVIAAGVTLGGRPVVLAAVTGALVLPWLVGTARSTAGRSRSAVVGRVRRPHRGGPRAARLVASGYRPWALGIGALLVVLAVAPPTGRAIVGLVLVLVVAPLLALRLMTWMDQRGK